MGQAGKNGVSPHSPPDECDPNADYLAALIQQLRSPLGPIRTAAELLRSLSSDGRQLQAIETIAAQTVNLTRMLDDVHDAVRLRRGLITLRKQNVDVAQIAAEALQAVKPSIDARRQNLLVSLPAHAVQMQCDPARLVQVLQNILDNATRYTPHNGSIVLRVATEGDELVIEVSDNGVGIEMDLLPHLFNVFALDERREDRQPQGLGLGLSISRNLVEMHGGTITAESSGLGRGSRFTIRLPIELQARSTLDSEPAGPPYRILIIDDHDEIAQGFAQFLSKAGHAVRTAGDGELGLTLAMEFKPQAVIIDIGLPGLDGFEVAERLRKHPDTAEALLLAISGYSLKKFRGVDAYAVFKHYLLKPVDPSVLLGVIERSLQVSKLPHR
jgi:CheY-like chemotaxis protein/two-component sensor histidine kinase